MKQHHFLHLVFILLFLPAVAPVLAEEEPATWPAWQQLVDDVQPRAALALAGRLREQALSARDDAELTRALVAEVRLLKDLGEYQACAEHLQRHPWPEEAHLRVVLELFQAQALEAYLQRYGHQIRKTEVVLDEPEAPLDTWSVDRFHAAVRGSYQRAWQLAGGGGRDDLEDQDLAAFLPYLVPNEFPQHIRGTVADMVTYQWVAWEQNSRFWLPREDAQTAELDFNLLLDCGRSLPDAPPAKAHPLERISHLLSALHQHHLAAGRKETAYHAQVELVACLAEAHHPRRRQCRQHLETLQADFDRDLPWWSYGQWRLARLARAEHEWDSPARAHLAARRGARRHPESLGGRLCDALQSVIELPELRLDAQSHDLPGRSTILLSHKNLRRVHLRAWRYDWEEEEAPYEGLFDEPDDEEIRAWIRYGEPDLSWTVELPDHGDYMPHETYTGLPACRPGPYVVVASSTADFRGKGTVLRVVRVMVGGLLLQATEREDHWELATLDGDTGDPLPGVPVTLFTYDQDRSRKTHRRSLGGNEAWRQVGQVVTDERGLARTDISGVDIQAALARRGDEVSLVHGFWGGRPTPDRPQTEAFIYTDRGVYRPGQEVHWKVVCFGRKSEKDPYLPLTEHEVRVHLENPHGEEVRHADCRTNEFGSASGSFILPDKAGLGHWHFFTQFGGGVGIRVEEYKRPTFEVTVHSPAPGAEFNEPLEVTGQARHYHGAPVRAGRVSYTVRRHLGWSQGSDKLRRLVPSGVVAEGETTLDSDGAFTFSFTPDLDDRFRDLDDFVVHYRVQVEVTSSGGETQWGHGQLSLGRPTVQVSLEGRPVLRRAGTAGEVPVTRRGLDGTALPGTVNWCIQHLVQPDSTALLREGLAQAPGAQEDPPWGPHLGLPAWDDLLRDWPSGATVAQGECLVGESGQAQLGLPGLDPGCYRLTCTATDAAGRKATSSRELVVAGEDRLPVNVPLMLLPEQRSVEVGQTLRVGLRSGYRDQHLRLLLLRDSQVLLDRDLRSGQSSEILDIPITENLLGGFTLLLRGVRDFQQLEHQESIQVPWTRMNLGVELITMRDHLVPGAEESVRIRVTGPDSQTVAAGAVELLATMYDRSLDQYAAPSYSDLTWLRRTEFSDLTHRGGLGWQDGQFLHLPDQPSSRRPYPSYRSADKLIWDTGRRSLTIKGGQVQGIPLLPAFEVEGAQYMVEVRSSHSQDDVVSERFSQYAIDSVEAALKEQAGVVTAAGQLAVRGGRSDFSPDELRRDFAPTAFFLPHVQTDHEGTALITFRTPDSVTDWKMSALAQGRDLSSGVASLTIPSRKDLMVRPYLPRFLREGDRLTLKVLVDNVRDDPVACDVQLSLQDPETGADLASAFGLAARGATERHITVAGAGGSELAFDLAVPRGVGAVVLKVTARSEDRQDGEQHLVPVLPGRMHLSQSRFAALRDTQRVELAFPDMRRADDPTLVQEQLVVTVDAQLFQGVLAALPYLVDYPYECVEQTLNRFLSAGILSSVYGEHPQVQAMARKLSGRETAGAAWDPDDPNRKLLLEETPWAAAAAGGRTDPQQLINLLDPDNAARATRTALDRLEKIQAESGGFSWWPGGRPSPYLTLYILQGLTRAREFGLEVPDELARRAWSFLRGHYRRDLENLLAGDGQALSESSWRGITYLNYLLSGLDNGQLQTTGFTADMRRIMLEHSYAHWPEHSLLLQGQLALTLARFGREDDARRVLDSIMDRSLTDPDLGTYWAPEKRAWLWYNDTVESHAFLLRVLTELDPADPRREGLVQWLFLNRHLGHWKSTRATAEVIHALVHYLQQEEAFGLEEQVKVQVGPLGHTWRFSPDEYTGADNRLVVPGEQVEPATMSEIVVSKVTPGLAFTSVTWHYSTEELPTRGDGDLLRIERRFFRRSEAGGQGQLTPLQPGDHLVLGEQVEVQLVVSARQAMEFVHLRDPRAAGLEPEDLNSGYRWQQGLGFYQEVRDSGVNFFFDRLPAGEHTLRHRLRCNVAGRFKVAPATLQSMYAPEFTAHSAGAVLQATARRD